jgi:iron complex outermembrane receptor protein
MIGAWALPGQAVEAGTDNTLADMNLEALLDMNVSGASRFSTRRSEAAASVTIITREDLLALGARTLADALRGVRGVSTFTDGTYQFASVRGMASPGDYNTRVLLLVDGNRINDNIYDQAFLGNEFPLDVDLIERIEFIPGQGSAVYGGNALFGVINVVTRSASGKFQSNGAVVVGSGGERQARASLRMPVGEGSLLLSGSAGRRLGYDVLNPLRNDGSNGGWAHGTDREHRQAMFMRWDQGPLTASLVHTDRVKGIPSSPSLIYGDPTNRYHDIYSLLNVQTVWQLGGHSDLTTRAYLGQYRFLGDYAIDYPPPTLNHDTAQGRWTGLEARVTKTAWAGQRLVFGGEWRRDLQQWQTNYDIRPVPTLYLDDHRHGDQFAVFGEDQLSIDDRTVLHLGVRADQRNSGSIEVDPRVALVWQAGAGLTLKAIHGQAYRAPNAYEVYYVEDAPGGSTANPKLRSERVRGDELAAEWLKDNLRLSGSLYQNHADQLTALVYDAESDRYQVQNVNTMDSRGLELELEYLLGAHRLRTHASWQLPVPQTSSSIASQAFPRRMAWASVVWALPRHWTLSLEAAANGRRSAAPGSLVSHLTLAGKPVPNGPRLSLSARNMFDRQLFDPGSDTVRQPLVRLPGREWRLELVWDFRP